MKVYIKLIAFVGLVLLPILGNAQQTQKNQKAVIKTSIDCSHCKQCETCGQLLQPQLLKVKGMKMVELDEKAMTITVYYDSRKTDLPAIKTAIANLGYDADDVKANPEAYERLDGCCKKA